MERKADQQNKKDFGTKTRLIRTFLIATLAHRNESFFMLFAKGLQENQFHIR